MKILLVVLVCSGRCTTYIVASYNLGDITKKKKLTLVKITAKELPVPGTTINHANIQVQVVAAAAAATTPAATLTRPPPTIDNNNSNNVFNNLINNIIVPNNKWSCHLLPLANFQGFQCWMNPQESQRLLHMSNSGTPTPWHSPST
jgi:hypothetical protein